MREFDLQDAEVTVAGTVVDAFLNAFGSYKRRGEKVVARHCGVAQVSTDLDSHYRLTGFLSAMAELQGQFGTGFMEAIGSFIFDKAAFPPAIDSLVAGMRMLDDAYRMNHRNGHGRIGGYRWEKTGERSGQMVCDNPYPCAFDRGLVGTIARRFEPGAKVAHDETKPCRHQSGESCTYTVEW